MEVIETYKTRGTGFEPVLPKGKQLAPKPFNKKKFLAGCRVRPLRHPRKCTATAQPVDISEKNQKIFLDPQNFRFAWCVLSSLALFELRSKPALKFL